MAVSINIPKDVAKVFDIKDNSDQLYRFLTQLSTIIKTQSEQIDALSARVTELENANLP